MARKPGVFERGHARLPAAQRLREGDDLKMNPLGVGKTEFILAVVEKAVSLVGDLVQAPGTEPVALSMSSGGASAAIDRRLCNARDECG